MIVVNARFLTQPVTGVQRFAIEISLILKKHYKNEIKFVFIFDKSITMDTRYRMFVDIITGEILLSL